MKKINPIPEGYQTITPYIMVENVKEYSTFLVKAFKGEVKSKTTSANGTILNIEVRLALPC